MPVAAVVTPVGECIMWVRLKRTLGFMFYCSAQSYSKLGSEYYLIQEVENRSVLVSETRATALKA